MGYIIYLIENNGDVLRKRRESGGEIRIEVRGGKREGDVHVIGINC